jgi:hypothetical protein
MGNLSPALFFVGDLDQFGGNLPGYKRSRSAPSIRRAGWRNRMSTFYRNFTGVRGGYQPDVPSRMPARVGGRSLADPTLALRVSVSRRQEWPSQETPSPFFPVFWKHLGSVPYVQVT